MGQDYQKNVASLSRYWVTAASQIRIGDYMPQSWWGKTLMWGYMAGYFIYVAAAGIKAWPETSFTTWSNHLLAESTYATFWPVLIWFH